MSIKDLKGINSKIIRGALNKTEYREQSESLFLTSGFVYDSAEQAENYLFGGPINTVKQGQPIPLVYGRMVTGSKTIMGSLFTTSSRAKISKARKLVGIGGFREDGSTFGNTAPAGRTTRNFNPDNEKGR